MDLFFENYNNWHNTGAERIQSWLDHIGKIAPVEEMATLSFIGYCLKKWGTMNPEGGNALFTRKILFSFSGCSAKQWVSINTNVCEELRKIHRMAHEVNSRELDMYHQELKAINVLSHIALAETGQDWGERVFCLNPLVVATERDLERMDFYCKVKNGLIKGAE